MRYNFNTIDGLFRPNYNVYKPSLNVVKTESEEPVRVIYNPDNMQRIKSIVLEIPQQENDPIDTEHITTDNHKIEIPLKHSPSSADYEFFMQELEKFIEKNPKYKDIKDSLANLAALESNYKLSIENYQGSGALGWFQFMDNTRSSYNTQTREQFAKDPQAQLLAAAQHYTKLQQDIQKRGGDPNDFVTMYGAWWRPASAYQYLKNPDYDFKTKHNESFQQILQRARNLLNKNGKGNS